MHLQLSNEKGLSMQQETRPYVNGFSFWVLRSQHNMYNCDQSSLMESDPKEPA
jgi:hypothetical protein